MPGTSAPPSSAHTEPVNGPDSETSPTSSTTSEVSELSSPVSQSGSPRTPGLPGSPEPEESEFARLEALLAQRTRSLTNLQRESERRDRLLREALDRIEATSTRELSGLRRQYESAVDRAVEAELARAELRFALDEALAQLAAAPAGARADVQPLYARFAELQKNEEHLRTSLRAAEDERDLARLRSQALEQQLNQVAAATDTAWLGDRPSGSEREDALLGERAGLVARLEEAERAWVALAGLR